MEAHLDQNSVRELMTVSAINVAKLLTTNQSMKETYFIRISDIPKRLKLYDIIIKLQKEYKLNFITNVHRSRSSRNIGNLVIGCRNTGEYKAFMARGDAIMVRGYWLTIEESRRPIGVNLVKVPEELKSDVKELSRVISFEAANSYSKVFPTERILEILLEMEADEWITNGIDGIWLKYIHHDRKLHDKVILSLDETISYNAISRFLMEYGNRDLKKRALRIIMSYKSIWKRENVYEVHENDEAIYILTKDLLDKDMLSNLNNFNSIRVIIE
ncbi:hypothetical protein ACKWTF_007382 [Chironomus riparius]